MNTQGVKESSPLIMDKTPNANQKKSQEERIECTMNNAMPYGYQLSGCLLSTFALGPTGLAVAFYPSSGNDLTSIMLLGAIGIGLFACGAFFCGCGVFLGHMRDQNRELRREITTQITRSVQDGSHNAPSDKKSSNI